MQMSIWNIFRSVRERGRSRGRSGDSGRSRGIPPLVFSTSPDRGPHWGTTWISVGGAFFKENSVAYVGDALRAYDFRISVDSQVSRAEAPRGEQNRFQIVVLTGHLNSRNSTGNAASGVISESELEKLKRQSEKTAYFTCDVLAVLNRPAWHPRTVVPH